MACGGGCCMDIYRLAPHPNMTMDRSSGTTIQNASSLIEPPMGAPISLGARRRYLIEKAIMRTKIKRLRNSDTPSRKKNSASTRSAIVEARSGNNGNPACTVNSPRRKSEAGRAAPAGGKEEWKPLGRGRQECHPNALGA